MIDYSKQTNYASRRMFLDPAGSVSIQRYDDFAFPRVNKFLLAQRGSFWQAGEMNLTHDKMDYAKADETTRFIFTQNLLRQTALDSIQGRAPVQIFTPVTSVPEAEAWVLWWSAFEQIHSEAYSHIVRNIYNMPTEQFNAIHDTEEIVGMLSGIDRYYHALHEFNSALTTLAKLRGEVAATPALEILLRPAIKHLEAQLTEEKHVKAVYMALVASYGLEAIRFMVSFSTSLGMNENKLFIGNGNIIKLILADETLHTEATAWIINELVRRDERFRAVAEAAREEVRDMLMGVIAEEKAWAKHQFQRGTVIGLTEAIMGAFVDWTAQERLRAIGVKYDAGVKSTPLPWFNQYLNTNKQQTALQENESVAYFIGGLTSALRPDLLPEI
jgi:ribonucleoside-diphosphate reductase beta chain